MRKIYAILSFLFFATSLNAQPVNSYVFVPSSGTYTGLTGATTSTATGDDGTQNVPIGFNFVFGGVTYTNAVLSTNGAIKLAVDGTTGFATSWTNNMSNVYGFPIIAALWDDNNATGGSVRFLTAGSAPNRTFSVEWVTNHLGGGGSSSTPTGTFKITLAETVNTVAIEYETIGSMASSTAAIGLNDLVSFLSVTPGTPATASPVTANNGIASNTNLTSGTTYTFFPPPPCVNPLNAGTATGPATVCTGESFTLSVTGPVSVGTGITYNWQSFDGVSWIDIPGATGITYTTSQSVTTQYRRKMTCSGTDAFSAPVTVTAAPPISSFPWTENFDALASVGATVFPPCWVKQAGDWRSANNASTGNDANARSAPNFIQTAWSTVANEFIWTPGFQLTAGTSYDFSFWYADFDVRTTWAAEVYFNSTPNSTGATQVGTPFLTVGTPSSTVYTNVKRTFVPSTSGVYYFGIRVAELTGGPWWLSFDDFRFEVTPPCAAPTGLSIANLTNTSVTLNWLASVTPPAGGYEWEVRTSGAPGSGAAGLAASGATGAGVLTANVPGLTANTQYSYYVRSACTTGSLYSAWTSAFVFRTLCNTINTFPYTETFEPASITSTCWIPTQVSGSVNWTYGAGAGNGGAITAAHGGAVNARHFGGGTGSVARLVSPALDLSGMNPAFGAQLTFWYANQNWAGDQNQLRVYYKTSAAGTWTLVPGAVYTTNVGVWTEVELLLPNSTSNDYYIAFEGTELFGWGVAVDDVTIAAAPTCPKPTAVTAVGTSPTSIVVNFTAPAGAYIVEVGPPGFTPGTTNTPGAGAVASQLGASSPITINTGLAANTTYDIYVRRICIPGVDFSLNVKTTATTLCAATNVPYLQNFETSTPPTGFPTCTSMQDVNGNSGPDANVTGGRWVTFNAPNNQTFVSPSRSMRYLYDLSVPTRGADDWFYIQGLNLTGGTSYRLKFFYKGSDGPTWIERLEVKYGTAAHNSAMANTLYTNTNIATALANPWDSAIVDFTPATTDVYYIGFHAISLPDQAFLYIDDISVRVTPLVDVGVTGITAPACPAANSGLPVTIRNYNTTTQDFANYPVTVTANITGAATTTLNTTINTGTLAPNASMTVNLPAFSYTTVGWYDITVATGSPNDPETANDAFTTSFYVNPSPATAVITPAAPAICIGDSVQLRTQFLVPPPAPVVLAPVSSGAISVAIPDASAVGNSHTMAVTGIPAGATITAMSVTINMTHTWINDIQLNLRAPNGKILNLFNRKGGFAQANITNMVISSATGLPAIPTTGAPFTGTWAPDAGAGGPNGFVSNATSFSELFSIGNGNWTLAARDYVNADIGNITSWTISITYGTPHPRVTWSPITGLFTNAATTNAYNPGSVLTADSIFAEPDVTTTYTVTTTNPVTGCTSTSTVTVTVNQLPTVNIATLPARICVSDTAVALNATPAGGNWTGIGVSGNNFLPPRTAVGTFNLTYTYTDPLGCVNRNSTTAKVEDCPERVILLRDNAVILFPNPNNGQFNIRINSVLYNKLTMHVYSSSGSLVTTQQFSGLVFNRVVPINLRHLPGGTYMVQFSYDGGPRTSEKAFKVIVGR
jgi:subtilisin-like proprotein convertase family protein